MADKGTERQIVVGYDGSECAKHALSWAIDETKLRGAKLLVVTTWHVSGMAHGAPGFVPIVSTPIDESIRKAAEGIANEAAEEARAAGIETDVVVRNAHPADVLVETAEDADLLVVGSRGHGGFAALLLGSVGQQCAHHSRCPVAIVR